MFLLLGFADEQARGKRHDTLASLWAIGDMWSPRWDRCACPPESDPLIVVCPLWKRDRAESAL